MTLHDKLLDIKSELVYRNPKELFDEGVNIKLDKKTYIKRAHRRNIAVQYWTINEEEDMRHLIDLGCDAIMTDDPELIKTVLDSYK